MSDDGDAPSLRRRFGVRVAAGFDRFIAQTLFDRSERSKKKSKSESLGPHERVTALRAVEAAYAEGLALGTEFFPTASLSPIEFSRGRAFGRGGALVDLRWDSSLWPYLDDPEVRAAIEARQSANRHAVARLYAHDEPGRPAIICLHGYLGGSFPIEERAFPIRFFHRIGLEPVLAVLPHHGTRGVRGRRPLLPASDPRVTIEGFRHAIADLRLLVRTLRERGAPFVGVMGMSLGGYTASLLATVEDVDFVVPMIPLASIADFARDRERLVGLPSQRRDQHDALERAYSVVSPMSRPPRTLPSRSLVLAARGDHITPPAHAARLAEHLGARTHTFDGGHVLQLGRGDAFRELARMLRAEGILAPRAE